MLMGFFSRFMDKKLSCEYDSKHRFKCSRNVKSESVPVFRCFWATAWIIKAKLLNNFSNYVFSWYTSQSLLRWPLLTVCSGSHNKEQTCSAGNTHGGEMYFNTRSVLCCWEVLLEMRWLGQMLIYCITCTGLITPTVFHWHYTIIVRCLYGL